MSRLSTLRRVVATGALLGLAATAVTVPAATAATAAPAGAGAHYYVAPDGNDAAAGTLAAPWASVARAQLSAQPGDTVVLRGGTYAFADAERACKSQTDRVDVISLTQSGTEGNPIRYTAHEGETPVLDFSGVMSDCRIKGISVVADWLVLEGLEVTGVRQNNNLNNESWGIWISGSNNIFDRIDTHHHMGAGLFIQRGGNNLVRNSDSHDNYDPYSKAGAGENADGFGSHVGRGYAKNVFEGTRAWANTDDGFDFISSASPVTVDRSWAWRNGYLPGTTEPSGNGNGFKVGGFGGDYEADGPKHTVRSSVAFGNRAAGFYNNHHTVANDYIGNTAFSNRHDFSMRGVAADGTTIGIGTLRNNVALTPGSLRYMEGTDSAYNSWDLDVEVTAADFEDLSLAGWDAPRGADGSLPTLSSARLVSTSDLIDRGVDLGAPYAGNAPDLGAYEFVPDGLEVEASSHCVNGAAEIAVTASAAVAAAVHIKTNHGVKTVEDFAAGTSKTKTFKAQKPSIDAGEVEARIEGVRPDLAVRASYEAVTCE